MFSWTHTFTWWWSVGVDSIPVIITGMFTYIKCSSYLRDELSTWSKFMSELWSSFLQISLITKSHGPHEWPMPGTIMGHTCAGTAGTNGDLQSVAFWGPTFCPLLMFMLVPHGAPDSKILWAHELPMRDTIKGLTWVANNGVHGNLQQGAMRDPCICLY